ncbi:LOW QUALITY PROTEIN: ATP-binding cassette sub-family F member 1 [Morone saxatilis]|uniref:LOW QUALITY PROTEIN: ATP-binding cassette sub-family F member 1 n=1 Tax=Morone saxatilis TaxID=34816 RepID=UPI0015E211AD|nr:LOW QUALITY PROTEIN: ATP-binding cassette sub-family F member 1 [Morone saxatilis]
MCNIGLSFVGMLSAEKTVKKGKKDKKGKKSFFEELSTDSKPEKADDVAVKDIQGKQPQKKKKDRRKGKGGDADDGDDEDVMLKLKKLSVQASDEEEEPVITPIRGNKKNKGGNIFAALSQGQSDEEEDTDEDEEDKPVKKEVEKDNKKDKSKPRKVKTASEEEDEAEKEEDEDKTTKKTKKVEAKSKSPENDEDKKPKKGKKEQQKKGKPAERLPSEDEDVGDDESDGGDMMMSAEDVIAEQAKQQEDDPFANLSKKEKKKKKKQMEYERQVASVRASNALEGDFSISQAEMSSRQAMLENASDIKLERFSISAHGKELFINADLLIVAGRRYGLVGPNGQHTRRWRLLWEEERRSSRLRREKDSVAERVGQGDGCVYEELRAIGAAAAEAKARRILAGLSFTPEMQNRPTKRFSGGWRMRVSLARALFMEPTLLMLDEPTNHLDLNAVIWLNNYLQGWKKTLLIVSHDQSFLDDVCTDIIHLDNQKLYYYRGNYLTFKKMYVQKQKELQKQYDKQEKKLKDLKAGGKSTKQAEKQTKDALTRKQQKGKKKGGQEEESQDATELLKRPKEYTVKFTFPNPPPLSPPILGLHSVDFGYEKQKPLFKNVDFGIDMDSRSKYAAFIYYHFRIQECNKELQHKRHCSHVGFTFPSHPAVIIVSHDARLITETQCNLSVVEDCTVNQIDGDFDDYKREVLESLGETMVNKVNP